MRRIHGLDMRYVPRYVSIRTESVDGKDLGGSWGGGAKAGKQPTEILVASFESKMAGPYYPANGLNPPNGFEGGAAAFGAGVGLKSRGHRVRRLGKLWTCRISTSFPRGEEVPRTLQH